MEQINLNNVKVGDVAVGQGSLRIRSVGVGSCVVVCLYDKLTKVGGMIHAMLPERSKYLTPPEGVVKFEAKYVDEGIDLLYREVRKMINSTDELRAKIAGGAVMFKVLREKENGIGDRNIEMARKKLAELKIPIDGEDVGGGVGRSVEFNLANGILNINTKI